MLKADHFSASCIQTIVNEQKPWTYEFMAHNEIGEDCLYLNVWTPAKSSSAKLPVFVYIYGGAFTGGSTAVPIYDGEGLASKGLVMVTVNYRVGILGFFTHPELTKESGHNASGNWGLLDQVAGLQWVHDNIAAFGGDPTRVTIAGQSAGATSVHVLTASPLAKGLFQRAISQSGSSVTGVGLMSAGQLAASEQTGVRFAESKGAKNVADLRAMTWQQVIAPVQAPTGAAGGRGGGGARFSLIVDGYFLPASLDEIFAQGKQNDVTEMTGLTANDMGVNASPNATVDTFKSQAARYQDTRQPVPGRVSRHDQRTGRRGQLGSYARPEPRLHVPLGRESLEDRQDQGLHVLLEPPDARAGRRAIPGVSFLGSGLRSEHALHVRPAIRGRGP